MLSITVNFETLSTAQRQYLSDFILGFPSKDETLNSTPVSAAFRAYEDPEEEDVESPEVAFGNVVEMPQAPPPPIVTGVTITPATPEGVSLDKNGFPWDARIYTSSKAKNADGSWRRKRGVDDATVALVEGELRRLMGIEAAPGLLDSASVVRVDLASPAPIALVPSPLPPPPPPPAPVAEAVVADPYIALISRASELIGAKVVTMDQVNAAIVAAGGVSLPLMNSRPDLIPTVMQALNGWAASA